MCSILEATNICKKNYSSNYMLLWMKEIKKLLVLDWTRLIAINNYVKWHSYLNFKVWMYIAYNIVIDYIGKVYSLFFVLSVNI